MRKIHAAILLTVVLAMATAANAQTPTTPDTPPAAQTAAANSMNLDAMDKLITYQSQQSLIAPGKETEAGFVADA